MGPTKPKEVVIPTGTAKLRAIFGLPSHANGVVAFAHGSGSGRLSPRNNFVAQVLQEAGIATLLADLLEEYEALDRKNVFDIDLDVQICDPPKYPGVTPLRAYKVNRKYAHKELMGILDRSTTLRIGKDASGNPGPCDFTGPVEVRMMRESEDVRTY